MGYHFTPFSTCVLNETKTTRERHATGLACLLLFHSGLCLKAWGRSFHSLVLRVRKFSPNGLGAVRLSNEKMVLHSYYPKNNTSNDPKLKHPGVKSSRIVPSSAQNVQFWRHGEASNRLTFKSSKFHIVQRTKRIGQQMKSSKSKRPRTKQSKA